jgi:hypothetical protein
VYDILRTKRNKREKRDKASILLETSRKIVKNRKKNPNGIAFPLAFPLP